MEMMSGQDSEDNRSAPAAEERLLGLIKNIYEMTKQEREEYEKLNPSKRLPVLQHGNKLVIGSSNIPALHLARTTPAIQNKLY